MALAQMESPLATPLETACGMNSSIQAIAAVIHPKSLLISITSKEIYAEGDKSFPLAHKNPIREGSHE